MIAKYWNNEIKKIPIDSEIQSFIKETEKIYAEKMNTYQFHEVLAAVFSFIKKLDQYINSKEPWQLSKNKNLEELDNVLSTLWLGINQIVVWFKPFMPAKAEEAEKYIKNIKNQSDKLNLFPRI